MVGAPLIVLGDKGDLLPSERMFGYPNNRYAAQWPLAGIERKHSALLLPDPLLPHGFRGLGSLIPRAFALSGKWEFLALSGCLSGPLRDS